MEDMSKFFLVVSCKSLPLPQEQEEESESPYKIAKTSDAPRDLSGSGQLICRGNGPRPTTVQLSRSLLNEEHYGLAIEFEQIDELSSHKWPLGMGRGNSLQLHQWPNFQLHSIPSHNTYTLSQGAAVLRIMNRNLYALNCIKRFVRHRCTILESFRQTQPPGFTFPLPRSSWCLSMAEVARLVAGALSLLPIRTSFVPGHEIVRMTSCPPDMVARSLEILQGMGLVRVMEETEEVSVPILKRYFTWRTEVEVIWMDLAYFVSMLYTLRQQRAILQQCVEQTIRQLHERSNP